MDPEGRLKGLQAKYCTPTQSWKCFSSPSSLKKGMHYALHHPWDLILPNEKNLPILP